MQLNKPQLQAVSIKDGPALILAGPGSGKTAVITRRVKYLIDSGVPPDNILVITFTRAAASEMRGRFESLSHSKNYPVTFGTFHSIFFSILCHEAGLNSNSVVSDATRYRILKELLLKDQTKYDDEAGLIYAILDEISAVKSIGGLKTSYLSKTVGNAEFFELYKGYNKKLSELRLIDFDDMISMTKKLFSSRKDVLSKWSARYKYIMVDEFQDVNLIQYEVLKLLAAPANNLFVVGDDDQTIYGFRGSNPAIMQMFPHDFKGTKRITLNINYRSTPEIIKVSESVISYNTHRYEKNLMPAMNSNSGTFPPPRVESFDTVMEENDFIIREIGRLHNDGVPYKEMALLYRTSRTYRAMIEALTKQNIPFELEDKVINIYDHWTSQDIITYLKIAEGSTLRSDFIKIINRPVRYIKREIFLDERVNLEKLIRENRNKYSQFEGLRMLKRDVKNLKGLSPYAAINYVRKKIGYDEFLVEYCKGHGIVPSDMLEILDELQESSKSFDNLSEWMKWIDEFKAFSISSTTHHNDAIKISSMHKSKGLEYEAVFIPDAIDGLIPHRFAKIDSEIEEERRVFYVSVTRAKKFLYIIYTKRRYNKNTFPSRFIDEMGLLAHKNS